MSWGTSSNPARFGYGQSVSDDRNLFLKVFGGEVLTAFTEQVTTMDKHSVRTITSGRSVQFPRTWKATAEYHTPGQEMLGNDIDTSEVTVTVDGFLVAHTAISDIDSLMSHFDVRAPYAQELGQSIARAFDKNVFRSVVLAARTAADGPFPAGNVITDAALTNTGAIDGEAWVEAIRTANIALFEKNVPEVMPRYCAVNKRTFDAIKYARDGNGNYLILDRQLGGTGSVAQRTEMLNVDGVMVYPTNLLPTANETSDTSVWAKYRANYSTTTGCLWTPMAVGTVKLADLGMETERDVRRKEDFMVASMLAGSGTLRAETAVEFKTS